MCVSSHVRCLFESQRLAPGFSWLRNRRTRRWSIRHVRDQRVVECGDSPRPLVLYQNERKQRSVLAGEWASWCRECGPHVSQEDRRCDRPYSGRLVADDAARVNRIEDRLVTFRDDFTRPKVLTADVDEVGVLGERPRESRTVSGVPRFLELGHEVRDDPLISRVHPLAPHPPSFAWPPSA